MHNSFFIFRMSFKTIWAITFRTWLEG